MSAQPCTQALISVLWMRSSSRRNDNSENPAYSRFSAARSAGSATACKFVSPEAPASVVSGGFGRKRTFAATLACACTPCTILAPFRLRLRWLRISLGFIRNTRPFLMSDFWRGDILGLYGPPYGFESNVISERWNTEHQRVRSSSSCGARFRLGLAFLDIPSRRRGPAPQGLPLPG